MEEDDDLDNILLHIAGRSKAPKAGSKRTRKEREVQTDSDDDAEDNVSDRSEEAAGYKRANRRDEHASHSRPSNQSRRPASAAKTTQQEPDEEDFDDGYGSDLVGDEEDRAKLMAMTELEREMILAERSERRDQLRDRRRNQLLLSKQRHAEEEKAEQRASTRMRGSDNAKRNAMAELIAAKRARDTKGSSRHAKHSDGEDDWASEDSLSESEESGGRPPRQEAQRAPQEEMDRSEREQDGDRHMAEGEESEDAQFEDAKTITVRRHKLAEWHDKPFFERTMPGTLVRLSTGGQRTASGEPLPNYMVAEVMDVVRREPGTYKDVGRPVVTPYVLAAGPSAASKTSKWLLVRRGVHERFYPMSLVSDQAITEEEFESWQRQCTRDNKPLLKRYDVEEVRQRLVEATRYTFTSQDVSRMLEEKRARGQVVKKLTAEREDLRRRRDYHRERGELDEAAALEQRLQELEAKSMDVRGGSKRSYGMSTVNKKNAMINFQNALRNISSRPENEKLPQGGLDPFSRRKTQPRTYWKTGRGEDGEPAPQDGLAAEAVEAGDLTGGVSAKVTETASGEVDLEINVGALDAVTRAPGLEQRLLGPGWQWGLSQHRSGLDVRPKRVLTLTDYRRRQGIA